MDEQANFSGSRPGLEVIRGVLNINLFHVESYWVRDSTTESCAADSIRRIQWSPRSARKIAFPSTFSEKNLPLETFRNRGPCTYKSSCGLKPRNGSLLGSQEFHEEESGPQSHRDCEESSLRLQRPRFSRIPTVQVLSNTCQDRPLLLILTIT